MGGGSYSSRDFVSYSKSMRKSVDTKTMRVTSGQTWSASSMKETMNPKNKIRECINTSEHPNTVPVILALDVTGSMGSACQETAAALGAMMDKLYKKFKDIEIMVMGVGDFECDYSPLQVSQFESDVRVAKQLDEIWMEHHGGGNNWESYTAPWFFGLYRTKLDAYDKQGRKGIIITMGDEALNPDLPENRIVEYFGRPEGAEEFGSLKTPDLYKAASKKFDIYHISVNDSETSYSRNKKSIEDPDVFFYKDKNMKGFKQLLGERYKVSTIDGLNKTIMDCIESSIKNAGEEKEHLIEDNTTIGVVTW